MSNTSKDRLKAYISGRVQGVGFRHFTTQKANELEVTGWVRNERDGRVHLVAEGERSKLDELLNAVHEGPASAHVENVDASWEDYEDAFHSFGVRR